jgi:hypothetical protein
VVLLQPEEPVLSEVAENPSKRMNEEPKLAFSILTFELEKTMQSRISSATVCAIVCLR